MRQGCLWLAWIAVGVALGACAPGRVYVTGEITIAEGIDLRDYAALHMRVIWAETEEVVMARTERLEDIDLPHEYLLGKAKSLDGDTVFVWLSAREDAGWAGPDDPSGSSEFVLCDCATHTLPYAEDVDITISP